MNITKYKETEQDQDLDLKIKMPKCMAHTFFYRPKFRTIDLMTNCWVDGHILTWWQSLSSCLNKTSLLTSEFEKIVPMKVLGNCLIFPTKKESCAFGLLELEIWVEQCLGCRTDSSFSFDAKIWTSKWQNWVLNSTWMF